MTTLEQLDADLPVAMKSRNAFATSTLRQMIAAVRGAAKAGPVAVDLTEDQVLAVLAGEVKKRRESAQIYTDAGAPKRARVESAEADFIETYLPAAVPEKSLDAAVAQAIAATGATSIKEMGKVMKEATATARALGRVDGKVLSAKVKAALA